MTWLECWKMIAKCGVKFLSKIYPIESQKEKENMKKKKLLFLIQ